MDRSRRRLERLPQRAPAPGPITFTRGLRRFHAIAEGFALAANDSNGFPIDSRWKLVCVRTLARTGEGRSAASRRARGARTPWPSAARQSVEEAWRARARRGVRNCGSSVVARWRWGEEGLFGRRGVGGARLSRIRRGCDGGGVEPVLSGSPANASASSIRRARFPRLSLDFDLGEPRDRRTDGTCCLDPRIPPASVEIGRAESRSPISRAPRPRGEPQGSDARPCSRLSATRLP